MEMGVVCVALVATALAGAVPASALIVTGGGSPSTDCLVVFDVDANYPPEAPSQVRCVDGDSTCDDDKTVDGICSLRVKVCVNSALSDACTASGVSQINVDHSFDTGDDPRFDPDFLALRQEIGMDFTFPGSRRISCPTARSTTARFDALAAAVASICGCYAVDESKFVDRDR